MATNQSAMNSIIRQLITEYHAKGMTLSDILERQIDEGHPAHEFIRVYKEMYPAESPNQPSAAPMPSLHPVPIPGPIAIGRPFLFACANGYLDLIECKFVPIKNKDADKLNSRVEFPDTQYYDGPSLEAKYLLGTCLQEFLDQIFPDPVIQNYVLNLYAEKLDGVRRRDEFVIHFGSGANGKTTFQELVKATFGDYYQNSEFNVNNPIKSDTRIILFHANGNQIDDTTIKMLTSGVKYIPHTSGKGFHDDYGMYMSNMAANTMPEINDIGAKRRIRVINYPSQFVDANDPKLTEPMTHKNYSARDYDICSKFCNWAPIFLEMLFERYKVLKATGFKQLESEIPASVRYL